MITYKDFEKNISIIKDFDKAVDTLYENKIDITNSLIFRSFGEIADNFWITHFTEEGVDWINWWLYEKSFLNDKSCTWDENGKEIILETTKDLWNLVKQYLK